MKERAKKRLFIAVDISDEARKAAADYVNYLKNECPDCRARWTKPKNLHLTIKFLGDAEETHVTELGDAIRGAAAFVSNFQLEINGTGVFPSAKKPNVLWLGIREETGNLGRLAEQLEKKCEHIGFPRDKRPFSPHLTIGRVRDPLLAKALADAHIKYKFEPVKFEVNQVVLYESKLDPGGSIYSPLLTASLS
jgi:2'-5' RNA ligase